MLSRLSALGFPMLAADLPSALPSDAPYFLADIDTAESDADDDDPTPYREARRIVVAWLEGASNVR